MKKKIFSSLLLVALALASTSMFVSCKDYDDDINKNAADLAALKSELDSRFAQCKANCDAEHSKFLTAHQSLDGYAKLTDIPSLDGYAKLSDIPSLEGYALQSELAEYVKMSEIQDALALINAISEKGVSAEDLANLKIKVAAIDEALLKLLGTNDVDKVAAAAENLKMQIDALDAYKKELEKLGYDATKVAELMQKIDNLSIEVQSFPADQLTQAEVDKLKEYVEKADQIMNQSGGANINVIQFMIDKSLASIVLKPDFYTAGLASIEVPALYYQPVIYCKDNDSKNEAYYYIDKNDTKLSGPAWRFDDGANAPSATIPALKWDPTFSGYDYTGEPEAGTMLPHYRSIVEKFNALKTAKIVPYAIARYHVNPTTVKLDDYKLSFYTNTAIVIDEVESRNTGYQKSMGGDDFAKPQYAEGSKYKVTNGLLEVPFKVRDWENYVEDLVYYADGAAIKSGTSSKGAVLRDSANFIALQMTKGDTATITSDYAAVAPALLHINALADNKPENKILKCNADDNNWPTKGNANAGHMYKYAQQAIDNAFTHSIPYNKTLDILPFVETHFTYMGATSRWIDRDQKMDASTFRKLGLHYEFSIVEYEDGNHATGESRHIDIDAKANENADFGYDEVILTPRSVKYDPNGVSFAEKYQQETATREAIDREPLIKVEIVDEANEVLEVGYIKLLITDNYYVEPVALQIDDDYWMDCTDEGGIKWSQVEESILKKLGENGYTKKQFEDEYEIELGTSPFAKRYIATLNPDGSYSYAVDANPIGDVTYTKITIDDPKDKQTNVIKWAIGNDYATIAKAITGEASADAAREALLNNKGDGIAPNQLATTIRFVKKNIDAKYKDMTAIYVTINIPAPQVHFAYGEVQKKDLSHWYALNSYKHGSEADATAIDILENVPTPAETLLQAGAVTMLETGTTGAPTFEFERPLYENFLNGIVTIEYNKAKFTKYNYANNANIDFNFTLPVEGQNAEFSHVNNTWKVKGISGHEYTLHLGKNSAGEDDKAIIDENNVLIVEILTTGTPAQPYIRMNDNDDANDILNNSGRYDTDGKDLAQEGSSDPFYLNNGGSKSKETFTAYLKIKTNDPCYELLLKGRYFNAKFLRPINVWGKADSKIDAKNEVQYILPTSLLTAKDWRDYTLYLDKDLNGDANYADGTIGWDFYNIYAISTKYNEIYTDHAAEQTVRNAVAAALANGTALSKIFSDTKVSLNKVSEIPALNPTYLNVTALKQHNGQKIGGKQYMTAPQTCIEYTNNGGNVQDFHLFIPVYIQYAWGHGPNATLNQLGTGNPNTLKVWTIVTIKKTEGAGASAKKN